MALQICLKQASKIMKYNLNLNCITSYLKYKLDCRKAKFNSFETFHLDVDAKEEFKQKRFNHSSVL